MKLLTGICWDASLMYVSEAKNLNTVQDTGETPSPEDNIAFDLAGPEHPAPSQLVTLAHPPPSLSEPPLFPWQTGVRGQGLTQC